MKTNNIQHSLQQKLIKIFEDNKNLIFKNSTPYLASIREKAFEAFKDTGFPNKQNEDWRHTDLSKALSLDYKHILVPSQKHIDLNKVFKCSINNFETDQVSLVNGWYISEGEPLKVLNNGVIIGSLAEAISTYPDLLDQHLGKYAGTEKNGFNALNTAFAQDGFFMYIPDGVVVENPVQMVSIINWNKNLFVQTRNLIIMGENL